MLARELAARVICVTDAGLYNIYPLTDRAGSKNTGRLQNLQYIYVYRKVLLAASILIVFQKINVITLYNEVQNIQTQFQKFEEAVADEPIHIIQVYLDSVDMEEEWSY